MHTTMKYLSKPKLKYCEKCIMDAYNKSKDEVIDETQDIKIVIQQAEKIENDMLIKLQNLTSFMEKSNHLSN